MIMFNSELKREIKNLKYDIRELKKQVDCLRGWHKWIVGYELIIRCEHCHKQADEMPSKKNTQGLGV